MPSLAVQMSGGCVCVGGVPLAPLLVCAPQRRFGNEKGHGVLDVASGQDTKSHHRTTIGPKTPQNQTLFGPLAKGCQTRRGAVAPPWVGSYKVPTRASCHGKSSRRGLYVRSP